MTFGNYLRLRTRFGQIGLTAPEAIRRLVEIGLRDERTEALTQHVAKQAAERRIRLKAKPKG